MKEIRVEGHGSLNTSGEPGSDRRKVHMMKLSRLFLLAQGLFMLPSSELAGEG